MKQHRARLLAGAAIAALAAGIISFGPPGGLFAPAAQALNLGDRTVRGTVLNTGSSPVAGVPEKRQDQIHSQLFIYRGRPLLFCPGQHGRRLRPVGGERRQEERGEDGQLVGRPQGLHLRPEAQVES